MVRLIFFIVCLIFLNIDNVNCNERFEFMINYLRKTADVPLCYKINDLKRLNMPLLLPNMYVGYITPSDSVDLFESYARTHWDHKKTLLANWYPIVENFNKLHRSKPIPIPYPKGTTYENDFDRNGK